MSIVRFRYRVYPTAPQRQALARAFGCVRVVFNDSLRLRQKALLAGEKLSDSEVQRRVVTLAKTTAERDESAARNILAAGQAVTACGDGVRPDLGPAVVGEAGTHRSAA